MDKETEEKIRELQEKAAFYRKEIHNQFDSTIERIEGIGKAAFLTTGIVLVSYGFLKLFSGSQLPVKKEVANKYVQEKTSPPEQVVKKQDSPLTSYVTGYVKKSVVDFLLSYSKDQIRKYLEKSKNNGN